MKTLVIVPTYNEKENITRLIREVFKVVSSDVSLLVVDDNSPDGTGRIVENLQTEFKQLHLLSRPGKQGLGRAYIAGFKWGLDRQYDLLVEMDADFSHRPEDLIQILKAAESHDFVVGSRYVVGGRTVNWGFLRKLISRGGSLYSRIILGYPLKDWTGGFNAWKSTVLTQMGLDQVQSNGYSFQIELKYRASRLGFTSCEVPIVFADRKEGASKMSLKIVIEAFYRVWLIRGA